MGDAVRNGENGHTEKEPDTRLAKRPRLVEANQVKNKAIVVLGAQWGDEGKGKVVDMLAGEADIVARCQVFFIYHVVQVDVVYDGRIALKVMVFYVNLREATMLATQLLWVIKNMISICYRVVS